MLVKKIEDMKLTALFVLPSQWKATKRLAKRERVSAAAIVREALSEFLEKYSHISKEDNHGNRNWNHQAVEPR